MFYNSSIKVTSAFFGLFQTIKTLIAKINNNHIKVLEQTVRESFFLVNLITLRYVILLLILSLHSNKIIQQYLLQLFIEKLPKDMFYVFKAILYNIAITILFVL